jgi:large subunit ribosomal protein L10
VNRAEKAAVVAELATAFQASPNFVLAGFSGLTVSQATELRRRVRAAGGTYRVVKNRLAKRAAQGTALEKLAASFVGPRAVVSHATDPLVLAKVLSEFASDNPELQIVAGVMDAEETLDVETIKKLASLPALPELRGQLLSVILMPATMLARLIGTPAQRLAGVIDARREKLGAEG